MKKLILSILAVLVFSGVVMGQWGAPTKGWVQGQVADSLDRFIDSTRTKVLINARADSATVLFWADTTLTNGPVTNYDLSLKADKASPTFTGTVAMAKLVFGLGAALSFQTFGVDAYTTNAVADTVSVAGLLYDTTGPIDTVVVIRVQNNTYVATPLAGDVTTCVYQYTEGSFIVQRLNATNTSGMRYCWSVQQVVP